jgi:hypothetical protein
LYYGHVITSPPWRVIIAFNVVSGNFGDKNRSEPSAINTLCPFLNSPPIEGNGPAGSKFKSSGFVHITAVRPVVSISVFDSPSTTSVKRVPLGLAPGGNPFFSSNIVPGPTIA